MNQIDTGKFIASCRKEKGLTQAQLAEKLNITDRAVSKWETGKCMPDSSIMLELCNILDVTVNELLSGERIEMNNYEEKVSENLIELKRKDAIHVIKIELSVISDHVSVPEIATSHIQHTRIPITMVIVYIIDIIVFLFILFSSFRFNSMRFSLTFSS